MRTINGGEYPVNILFFTFINPFRIQLNLITRYIKRQCIRFDWSVEMLLENYESSIQLTVMTKNISRSSSRELNQIPKMNDTHTRAYTIHANKNPLTEKTHRHALKHTWHKRTLLMNIAAPHTYIPLHSFFLIQIMRPEETKQLNENGRERVRKRSLCTSNEHDENEYKIRIYMLNIVVHNVLKWNESNVTYTYTT